MKSSDLKFRVARNKQYSTVHFPNTRVSPEGKYLMVLKRAETSLSTFFCLNYCIGISMSAIKSVVDFYLRVPLQPL